MLTNTQIQSLRAKFDTQSGGTIAPAGVLTRVLAIVGEEEPLLAQIQLSDDSSSGTFVVVTSQLIVAGEFSGLPARKSWSVRDLPETGDFAVKAASRKSLRSIELGPDRYPEGWVHARQEFVFPWQNGARVTLRYPDFDVTLPQGPSTNEEFFSRVLAELLEDLQ